MTRIILFANSHKNGNRCLAGVTNDGLWLRPVSSPAGAAISTPSTFIGETPLRPLDVIDIEIIRKVPLPSQGENVLIDDASIAHVRTIGESNHALAKIEDHTPWFMTDGAMTVNPMAYTAIDGAESLALIRVTNLVAHRSRNTFDGAVRWRASFSYNGLDWDLPLTDDLFTASLGDTSQEIGHASLCLSIGEEFRGEHYKLVAGVVPH